MPVLKDTPELRKKLAQAKKDGSLARAMNKNAEIEAKKQKEILKKKKK